MFRAFVSNRPSLSIALSVTENVPACEKAWVTCEPEAVPPSPNVHSHATTVPGVAPGRSSLELRPSKLTTTPIATLPVGLVQCTGHGSQTRPGAAHVQRAIGSLATIADVIALAAAGNAVSTTIATAHSAIVTLAPLIRQDYGSPAGLSRPTVGGADYDAR